MEGGREGGREGGGEERREGGRGGGKEGGRERERGREREEGRKEGRECERRAERRERGRGRGKREAARRKWGVVHGTCVSVHLHVWFPCYDTNYEIINKDTLKLYLLSCNVYMCTCHYIIATKTAGKFTMVTHVAFLLISTC